MASRTPVYTDKAPPPRPGIYTQAIVANGLVFVSGCRPLDPKSGVVVQGDIQAHTHQCIQNLGAILDEAGSSLQDVVEVNVFLSDINDFDKMNDVYKTYWGEPKPARTCVVVKTLPGFVDIEIKCIGVIKSN